MDERRPQDFVRSAERRLRNASDICRLANPRVYDDIFLDMADVAMLVWSAGIDLVSTLMLLAGEASLGASTQRRRYLRERLDPAHPHLGLLVLWASLARLHNFQHNLDMPQPQFELDCGQSRRLFDELNKLLPVALQLPADAYGWLAEVG